jgi:predicted TIM-barrel fold metal-dependent hydrolase
MKWLPSAMGIDPADPALDPFYAEMQRLGIVLLTHAGEEQAVEADELQKFGNPLRLRRPLDAGVRVIVAHCASRGADVDLDDPAAPTVPSYKLFLRLMDDPRYSRLVFGEISALTQTNRVPEPLATLLARTDLHPRLVYGSDYPLPAINVFISTRKLCKHGFITAEERSLLNEIYDYNPLLFSLLVARTVRHPITGARFAPEVFRARDW